MKTLVQLLNEQTTTVIAYRGDKQQTDVTKFDRDLAFFTSDRNVAKSFGQHITKVKLTFDNPLVLRNGDSWQDVPIAQLFNSNTAWNIVQYAFGHDQYQSLHQYYYDDQYAREPISIDIVAQYINQHTNYDGIIVHNIDEGPLMIKTTVYIAFKDKATIVPL